MVTKASQIPYYNNALTPPLTQEHVDNIFYNHLQSTYSLPVCICTYLKELAGCHYQNLRVHGSATRYELSPKDLTMYYLGEDAPFSLIITAFFVADPCFLKMLNHVCLPPACDDFLHYNAILQNRVDEVVHLIDPQDEKSVLNMFDFLCKKPFFPNQEYFLAGCETSKMLYLRTCREIDKLIDFDTEPKFS